MRSSEIQLRKLKLRLRDNALLTTRSPVLPSGSNRFSWSWFFRAVVPRIYLFIYRGRTGRYFHFQIVTMLCLIFIPLLQFCPLFLTWASGNPARLNLWNILVARTTCPQKRHHPAKLLPSIFTAFNPLQSYVETFSTAQLCSSGRMLYHEWQFLSRVGLPYIGDIQG